MLMPLLHLLAQINPDKIRGTGEPELSVEHSYGLAWVIAGLSAAVVILIACKTSHRNAFERE
jgi:hypothetical protein